MLKSMVGQWTGSTPLKKAKCTIVVYSIGEFISSQLPERPRSQLGRYYTLCVGPAGRRVGNAVPSDLRKAGYLAIQVRPGKLVMGRIPYACKALSERLIAYLLRGDEVV